MDTDVPEEHAASVIRAEGCRVRKWLRFVGDLQGKWSPRPRGKWDSVV
jgi:hypothetical protein